jgi:hypothetical protein
MRKMLAAMAGGMLAFTQWHCRPMPTSLTDKAAPSSHLPTADTVLIPDSSGLKSELPQVYETTCGL